VDLHGYTRQGALELVEKTIDRALLDDTSEITFIHGIGDGILKKAVRDYLDNSPHISSVKETPGNHGSTIAYI
jgi:DNA mismatch repair protein MutS2